MADLTEIQSTQSVKIIGSDSTGLETTPVGSATNGELLVIDGLRGGINANLILATAGTQYEVKVGASPLSNRKCIIITALNNIYWGTSNSVTVLTGTPLMKNQQIVFNIVAGSSFSIWLVSAIDNSNARIVELS